MSYYLLREILKMMLEVLVISTLILNKKVQMIVVISPLAHIVYT